MQLAKCIHDTGFMRNGAQLNVSTYWYVTTAASCCAVLLQESVFSSVGKSIIDSCMSGYNGTIFA